MSKMLNDSITFVFVNHPVLVTYVTLLYKAHDFEYCSWGNSVQLTDSIWLENKNPPTTSHPFLLKHYAISSVFNSFINNLLIVIIRHFGKLIFIIGRVNQY